MPERITALKQMITHVLIIVFTLLCIAYAGLNLYALVAADRRIFPAPSASYEDNEQIFKLETADGAHISATYLEASGRKQLMIYSHGNGEDIGTTRALLEQFQAMGISVLSYDYPGYGTSSGVASEAGCYASIQAVYLYAKTTLGFSPKQIILYGHSLGSGPSTWLAAREPVAGLILHGAFTSTFRVLSGIKLLAWDRFDNIARLPKIKCTTLFIHGTADRTVPFSHATKNWQACPAPNYKLWVENAGHGNLLEIADNRYWQCIDQFFKDSLAHE